MANKLFLTKLASGRMIELLQTLQELNEAIAEDSVVSEMIPELECYSDQLSELANDTLNPVDRYLNYYECVCGAKWTDEWESTCNDRCPDCNTEIEPYKSEDIED